ncbi:Aste57867_22672 [Aphanomyces stellatus]|uniref:Aste57867_22672 protein n=1 Tax=Aphanomyces stellatus TaxID=120398 RepID=A0A485LMC8_9STRA|nr:hypothetical protein As57867_022602 [Aphanomyces stellatus]VFT99326.1 Aste57867_22672 [Aphanomyces stellatus]
MNILDLGFFAAIQSLQHRSSARTIDELVSNVHRSFDEYPMESLDMTFMSLQACLTETLRHFGDNSYKIPHMSKSKLARKGLLPRNCHCPPDVYAAARARLGAVSCFESEQREARTIAEVSRLLEAMDLEDLRIEPISMDEEE